MSFRQNLLKKIQIDQLTAKITASVGPADSDKKTDKALVKQLLEMSSYIYHKERDLDLYISEKSDVHKVLVLDNELAFYKSAPKDVGLRKSPTIKEMLNVFNVIKILNDSDVVVCKKEASVSIIQKDCISLLDLSYDESDIREISIDGMASLESAYADGVKESLILFAELLGYVFAPKAFQINGCFIIGLLRKKDNGQMLFGPMIIYSLIHKYLKYIEKQLNSADKDDIKFLNNVVSGKEKASQEGIDVFKILKEAVINASK